MSFAEGTTYFVAPGGKDSNTGTSVEQPFRTLQRAASALGSGDTCLIRAGVYRECVRLTRSGEQKKPIAFAPYQSERVIVDGSDVVAGPWVKIQGAIWAAKIPPKTSVEATDGPVGRHGEPTVRTVTSLRQRTRNVTSAGIGIA